MWLKAPEWVRNFYVEGMTRLEAEESLSNVQALIASGQRSLSKQDYVTYHSSLVAQSKAPQVRAPRSKVSEEEFLASIKSLGERGFKVDIQH